MLRTTTLPLKVAVRKKIAEIFFRPYEKNVCISHAVKQGKLRVRERESG